MLPKTKVQDKKLSDYRDVILPELYDEILARAEKLKGLHVIHFNATAVGGGVAEILSSLVPLMNDIGLRAEWRTIPENEPFFEVTKKMHNTLQGQKDDFTKEEKHIYSSYNEELAGHMSKHEPDIWIIHDPQPAATLSSLPPDTKAIWRCHIDTTNRHDPAWEFLKQHLDLYSKYVFSLESFVPDDIDQARVRIIPPAIDPLSEKNRPIDRAEAKKVIADCGVDPSRPLLTQVSRFDPWKDPKGVIDAFRIARKEVPGLQLAMVGLIIAKDDPEAYEIFDDVKAHAGDDPDIHLFADPEAIPHPNDIFVQAFQAGSDVVVQKSLREGFGLVVTEAMWKGNPVIGGDIGGIRLQIKDGESGYLVSSIEECAQRIIELFNDEDKIKRMGIAAKEAIRRNFLITRLLNDYLKLFEEMI